jgi:hypothetical protein
MHVVNRPDEEFKGKPSKRTFNQVPRSGSDPIDFETDDDLDLGGVFLTQSNCFLPVCGFICCVAFFCIARFNLEVWLDVKFLKYRRDFAHFFRVEIFFVPGHVFRQAKDLHLFADGCLDHIF